MRRMLLNGLTIAVLASSTASWSATSQLPLHLSSSPDPNVLLNMSVESPMGGAAYNDQPGTLAAGSVCTAADGRVSRGGGTVGTCYFPAETYLGYFDPLKCYSYNTTGGYFQPAAAASATHTCSNQYSGNFMNWATMTAMDMFVWTMTGGNRTTDTNSLTVVKRTRKTNNDNWFPHKYLNSSDNVSPSTVTPFGDSSIYIENTDFGVKFGTTRGGSEKGSFNVSVKVCDSGISLESNCKLYGGGTYAKPEGLIQKNADSMRFGVTSYSLAGATRDGGVLRSNMKYVGATKPNGSGGTETNALAEISAAGLLLNNPNASDATASGVSNSGVINYVNKFSDAGYKSRDPASELYYESLRYFKNIGRTPEYADGLTNAELGGFPAVTTWEDPIIYSCQKNFILGINDANPWQDKRLPGTFFTSSTIDAHTITDGDYGEPSNPDPEIDVTDLTNQVGDLEGINGTSQCIGCTATSCISGVLNSEANDKYIAGLGEVMGTCPAPQKENSYYIAGLAYYANTQDIRTGMTGKQTISSFFIDTQEYNANPLTGQMNMLWLAGKYGGFIDSNGNNQPDLTSEWDADGDGEPDSYVLASRPDKLVAALNANFAEIDARSSSITAVTTSSTRLNTSTKAFQARFNSGDWTGQLLAFPVNSNGSIGAPLWDAASQLPAHDSRNIVSWSGTAGFDFTSSVSNLAKINAHLTSAAVSSVSTAEVSYLRGDQSQEEQNGGAFRDRSSLLGDIVNSDPVYVGLENYGYSRLPGVEGTHYSTFRSTSPYSSRDKMLYVGANDGMLHGFNASTGQESMAYIPVSAYANLNELFSPGYSHRYFVDGSPKVGDAYFDHDNDTNKSWRSVLVGSAGAGGSSVFALDVTDPSTFSASNVYWDVNNSLADYADLGDTIGTASIVRLPDGNFYAVFGNGFNSSSGNAVIYLVPLSSPGVPTPIKLDTHTSGNGMASPVVVDTDGDWIGDTIYAGDLKGNLWKAHWDTASSSWGFSFGTAADPDPLFTAVDEASPAQAQSITSRPNARVHPAGGVMVYFGTGKYFETSDNVVGANPQVHTFYAIHDEGAVVSGRAQLLEQELVDQGTIGGFNVRTSTNNSFDVTTPEKGWYLDLKLSAASNGGGERVVTEPILNGDRVIFSTLKPSSDVCSFGGSSSLVEINSLSGSRLSQPALDTNGDGIIDGSDNLNGVVVSTIEDQSLGIFKKAAILYGTPNEVKLLGGSSGTIGSVKESSATDRGRQSWQQLQ